MTDHDLLWLEMEQAAMHGDRSAARMHLLDGNPIYTEPPPGAQIDCVLKLYPDGRRQIVRFGLDGEVVVAELLPLLPKQHWWRRSS